MENWKEIPYHAPQLIFLTGKHLLRKQFAWETASVDWRKKGCSNYIKTLFLSTANDLELTVKAMYGDLELFCQHEHQFFKCQWTFYIYAFVEATLCTTSTVQTLCIINLRCAPSTCIWTTSEEPHCSSSWHSWSELRLVSGFPLFKKPIFPFYGIFTLLCSHIPFQSNYQDSGNALLANFGLF